MKWLRRRLDAVAPTFEPGGRYERLGPVFEVLDSFLFSTNERTQSAAHVRDALNVRRIMALVVVALVPCTLFGLYNTGYQSHLAIAAGAQPLDAWQSDLFEAAGFAYDPHDILACTVHGSLYFFPILFTTLLVGGGIEVLAAISRRKQVYEAFLVTAALVPLTLPPTIPLWQVAAGVAFGIVFGKEVFGGTGMNFLNPALVVRAFLFFAYPAQMSGEVWTAAVFEPADAAASAAWEQAEVDGAIAATPAESPVDVVTRATPLARVALDADALKEVRWWDAFVGRIPGSIGETSTLACLLGAALLLATRLASWRTMLGVAVGSLATSLLLHRIGSDTNPMFAVPFHWHVVLGGWALGTVFMATDPVSSAFTDLGRFLYGTGIGALTILIRCINPGYPEGMMLAILFMNMFAPLLDHYVVRANIRFRSRGYERRG